MSALEVVRNVPKSQVWAGSRGRHTGRLHLRIDGRPLCGRKLWHVERDELDSVPRCPACEQRASRRGIAWPS